ncbi:MAG: TRAP transporter substrate-binding protein DctP [Chloroflexi bacterium]|nr:TRAP transporter substrate-binding protein DctP [Chloroflexota bacterium]
MFGKKHRILVTIILALTLVAVIGCSSPTPAPAPTTQAPAPTTQAPAPTTQAPAPTTQAPAPSPTFKSMVLSYANPLAANQPQQWTETVKPWFEAVTARTNGAVTLRPYHDGSLLGLQEMAQGMKIGTAHLGNLQTSYYNTLLPAHTVDNIPYMGGPDPYKGSLIARIIWSEFEIFNQEIERENMVNLFTAATAPQDIIVKKEIKTLKDMEGQRIRALGVYFPKLLSAVGIVPVAVSFADVYEAIQRGVLDGGMTAPVFIHNAQWDKLAKYLVEVRAIAILASGIQIVANMDTWKGLDPELKKIMLEEAQKREQTFGKFMNAEDVRVQQEMVDVEKVIKVKLPEADMQEWVSKAPDVFGEYARDMEAKGIPGNKIVDRIQELVEMPLADVEKLAGEAWTRDAARLMAMK